jgi:hypothetical protein
VSRRPVPPPPEVMMVSALTQKRLHNAALEDRGQVIGMNRLRAAYLDLDPGIERCLVTSAHDDDSGLAFLGGSAALAVRLFQRMHRRYVPLFPASSSKDPA